MEKYIIENGITYELRGEQYYPVFKESEQYQIGKYGLLHLEFIKANHRQLYSTLLMEGKLNGYLHEMKKYFPDDMTADKMKEVILSLLSEWKEREERRRERSYDDARSARSSFLPVMMMSFVRGKRNRSR